MARIILSAAVGAGIVLWFMLKRTSGKRERQMRRRVREFRRERRRQGEDAKG